MKLIKETKKYTWYSVKLENIGDIVIKDPLYAESKFKFQKDNESYENFYLVKFENISNGNKSQCECSQENIFEDLEKDIEKIKKHNISNTKFYSNWMKLLFIKNESYQLDYNGKQVKGIFCGNTTFKTKTFYFLINGKRVKASGLNYNGYSL